MAIGGGMGGMGGVGFAKMGVAFLGGITDYLESKRVAKGIEASKSLDKSKIERAQRVTVGKQVSAVAGSGAELSGTTLDSINTTRFQYELDEAIGLENSRLQKRAIQKQGRDAIAQGVFEAFGTQRKTSEAQKSKQQALAQRSSLLGSQKQTAGASQSPLQQQSVGPLTQKARQNDLLKRQSGYYNWMMGFNK